MSQAASFQLPPRETMRYDQLAHELVTVHIATEVMVRTSKWLHDDAPTEHRLRLKIACQTLQKSLKEVQRLARQRL